VQELKLAEIARERRRESEKKEYKNIVEIFRSGRTYQYDEFKEMLEKMRKPFSCTIEGRDVSVNEADAAIMMEKLALDEISKILVSNKRGADAGTNENPVRKKRRNNAACNTRRGATGFDAIHGAARRDHRDSAKEREKRFKATTREKESIEKLLASIKERKEECEASYQAAMKTAEATQQQEEAAVEKTELERQRQEMRQRAVRNLASTDSGSASNESNLVRNLRESSQMGALPEGNTGILRDPTSSDKEAPNGGVGDALMGASDQQRRETGITLVEQQQAAAAGNNENEEILMQDVQTRTTEREPVSVTQYWEVLETSTSLTIGMFLQLFLPKSGVTAKNKPIKWKTLLDKVITPGILTRTQFDSRVENLHRKLGEVEAKLEELEPDTQTTDETEEEEITEDVIET
jgi:hypothetical protein